MKLRALYSAIPLFLALASSRAPGAEVVIVDWNHAWDYMHPMGLNPALADPDFDTTWFLNAPDFASSYNGLIFGGVRTAGVAGNTSSYDHGTGAGPLGYGTVPAMEYFSTGGAEMTAMGTTLTLPSSGNRYTAYFRTTFTTTQAYNSLRLRGLIDDSALIYLDGVLVARVNRADNTEAYNTVGADGTASRNETGVSANNEACIQSILPGVAGNAVQAEAVVITPVTLLTPGQHTLAVSVQNAAATSSDCGFGLQLRGDDAFISAVASNVQRQENGPGFADDTFSFDVSVTANNLPAAFSWTSDNSSANGPALGSYGPAVVTYTYLAQVDTGTLTTVTIKYTDSFNPLLTSSITLTAPPGPLGPEIVLSPATPSAGIEFEEAGLMQSGFLRQAFHTELGFTSNGAVIEDNYASDSGSKMLRFSGVNALMTTEAVKLDPSVKGINAGVTVRTFTNSTSGFEGNDTLRVSVEGSPDGTTWTDIGAVVPTLAGNDATAPNPAGIDQLLVKLGPGTTGEPDSRSRRGWIAKGYPNGTSPEQFSDTLSVPAFIVPDNQEVKLEFTHRYSFELSAAGVRYDGGNVQISIDGGAPIPIPATAFSEHGYDGVITGVNVLSNLEGFNSDSPGYRAGNFVTSVLTIPGVTAGNSVVIHFVGGWDYNLAGANPNWQITDIKVRSGKTTLYAEDFSTGGGGLVATSAQAAPGWIFDDGTLHAGPAYHSFKRLAVPVPAGVQYVRMKLSEPSNVVLSTSEFYLIDHVKLAVGLDPLADADGDGVNNGLEDVAGTDPADAQSVFRVAAEIVAGAGGPGIWHATFTFPAADFRVWRLQSSNDLQTWVETDVRYGDPLVPQLSLSADTTGEKNFWRVGIGY